MGARLDPVQAEERRQVLGDLLEDLIARQAALLKRFDGSADWQAGSGPLYQRLDESFQAVKRALEKALADGLAPGERIERLLERSREGGELLARQVARRQTGVGSDLSAVRVRRRQIEGAGAGRTDVSGRSCDLRG
jgi:hypothetical protein